MDVLMRMGFTIPRDVSLCGIDDIDMSSHQSIRLTTVGNYKRQMGELAMERLIELIESEGKPDHPTQIVLRPELVIRDTTSRLQ
jgi:DNA-binding LacI/PurR family transcriptional regulator